MKVIWNAERKRKTDHGHVHENVVEKKNFAWSDGIHHTEDG